MKRLMILLCIFGAMMLIILGCCSSLLTGKDLALAKEQVFFRDWGWRIVGVDLGSDGLTVQVKLENPEPQGEVRSVVAIVDENLRIWDYWFFDKEGNPRYWLWNSKEKIYVRSPEKERQCSRCHGVGGKNKYKI